MTTRFVKIGFAGALGLAVTAAVDAQGFRVTPYQQAPTADGVTVTWWSTDAQPGTFTMTGGDLPAAQVITTSPTAPPLVQGYTDAERQQAIDAGYPLHPDGNYRHRVQLTGLTPGTDYAYRVTQGGQTADGTVTPPPTADAWSSLRLIVLADSETHPIGRTHSRDWESGTQAPGSQGRPPDRTDYLLTETHGHRQNMRIVNQRDADLVLMPGDLVQGSGSQLAWDEFWRHHAGDYDTSFADRPLLPAYGNWENFAAINGGYGTPADRTPVAVARHTYKDYIDAPANGTPAHQDNYYRVDYGPVTIITLDSSNGTPDRTRTDGLGGDTDTQEHFTAAQYAAAVAAADPALGLTNDLADFNLGSTQYAWAQSQIAAARDAGQIVFVQWHHAPYSSGTHGFAMDHPDSSGQGGTPMR